MKTFSKKVVLKRDPEHGWPTEWKWACSICGRKYERQSEAELCCSEKKDDTARPWLKKKAAELLKIAKNHPKQWFYVTHAYCSRCGRHVDLADCMIFNGAPYCPRCHHPLRMRLGNGNAETKRLRWQYLTLLGKVKP